MKDKAIEIRLMKAEDLDSLIRIDEKVLKISRREYYNMKFELLFESKDYVPASLVACVDGGTVVGFVMGEVYIGEFGISSDGATLDTIGVDPDYEHMGVGKKLIEEFVDHLRHLGIKKIYTLVSLDETKLIRFFNKNQFVPSKTVSLERVL